MTVKGKRDEKRDDLSLPEKECLDAIRRLMNGNGGDMPRLREIFEAIDGRVSVSAICKIRQSLKKKGYFRVEVPA